MSERIVNGSFATNIDSWVNGGGSWSAFGWESYKQGRAGTVYGDRYGLESFTRFGMKQSFSIGYQVVSATIDAYAYFYNDAGDPGTVKNWIILEKPDTTQVTLFSYQETGGANYWDHALNAYNATAHFTQQGTYKIILLSDVTPSGMPATYHGGGFDAISVNVAVKKTKTMIETLGVAGTQNRGTEVTLTAESFALGEISLTTTLKQGCDLGLEDVGLVESMDKTTQKYVFETMGLSESLTTYLDYFNEVEVMESMALVELLTAQRTAGNVVTNFSFGDPTQWTDATPIDTLWRKYSSRFE